MNAMIDRHHLDDATLVSYSAGALPAALALVAATHIALCPQCRARLACVDRLGGMLMHAGPDWRQEPTPAPNPLRGRDAMLARLDALEGMPLGGAPKPAPAAPSAEAGSPDPDLLPGLLHPHFGTRYSALRWRLVAPGLHRVQANGIHEGQLMLLKLAPGMALPPHGHGGSEMTLVLKGAYNDCFGRYGAGDIADLDEDIEHQPVAEQGEPCIALAGTDAPLRFKTWGARLVQRLVGI
ncbi:FIG111991: hypothetical protein [plant metagenome]|uniref:ChrR-like cupin domain-containing protein n=1 Tax=plant metagenome TaxID=1297885 RepID=A0A484P6X2_9ZZZZ